MRHLTWTDRLLIERHYNDGDSVRSIAKFLGFAPSSISDEIKKGLYEHLNSDLTKTVRYSAQIAEDAAKWAASAKGCPLKIGKNHKYCKMVSERILKGESPDSIVGDLKRREEWTVSTPTLYRYISAGYIPGVTSEKLWEKAKRKHSYSKVKKSARPPKGTSIEKRPSEINDRSSFGHWEMDSVIGKAKGKGESILVLTERFTRYEIIFKVADKTAKSVVSALSKIIPQYPQNTFRSITVDNGSEFSDFESMSQYAPVYYCHPYTSSERGSNERANRIIRRFFPKGESLKDVTQSDCERVANYMNRMHRKILGYDTAESLFLNALG